MSVLAWCTIVYGILALPALVVFFTVFITERNSQDQPPYVRAAWASLAVPLSGWVLYPVLILGAVVGDLSRDLRKLRKQVTQAGRSRNSKKD